MPHNSIVTIVRHRSGFSNVSDAFRISACIEDAQSHLDPYTEAAERYYLPAGYSVSESAGGSLEIYDGDNDHCTIVQHSSGRPQLISARPNMPVLKLAD